MVKHTIIHEGLYEYNHLDFLGVSKMNCWKSINFNKEFGLNRLYLLSFLTGLVSFTFLYVLFSIVHNTTKVNELGVFPLIIALLFLPTVHSLMHILPLILMNKRSKLIYKRKNIFFPVINYYTKKHLSKKAALVVVIAPTFLITVPGLMASYMFVDYYVYFLLFTAVHIGITLTDFMYIIHVAKAPKKSFIENNSDEISILVKAQD